MASWAPDWRQQIRRPCTRVGWDDAYFCASKGSKGIQSIEFPDTKTITLNGTFVDSVCATGSVWDPSWLEGLPTATSKQYLNKIREFCKTSLRIKTADVEITTALVATADNTAAKDSSAKQAVLSWYDELLTLLNSSDEALDLDHGRTDNGSIFAGYMRSLHSRKSFISQTGYVGLAPMHVLPGDRICIFLDGNTPYVIRLGDVECYQLVGEAYVHGIMYGRFMRKKPGIERVRLR